MKADEISRSVLFLAGCLTLTAAFGLAAMVTSEARNEATGVRPAGSRSLSASPK